MKECNKCGKKFEGTTKYCSTYCQGQAKKKPRECETCGSIFLSKNKHARFCSSECRIAVIYKESRVTLECQACGIEFERLKSRLRYSSNFCSIKCSSTSTKVLDFKRKSIDCDNCGKTFEREFNAIRETHNYCSHSCYAEHVVETKRLRGEHNPNYNSALTDEERWAKRNYFEYYDWRESVYKRDNYSCKCCGIRGVELNAHHILNYATHKELRTSLDNGVTLCTSCHKEFHSRYGRYNNNAKQLEEFFREVS